MDNEEKKTEEKTEMENFMNSLIKRGGVVSVVLMIAAATFLFAEAAYTIVSLIAGLIVFFKTN